MEPEHHPFGKENPLQTPLFLGFQPLVFGGVFLLILWEGTRQYFPGKPETSMGFLVPGPDPLEAYTLCLCAIFGSLRRCGRCIDTLWAPWLPNNAGVFWWTGRFWRYWVVGWFWMNSMMARSPTQWSFGEILCFTFCRPSEANQIWSILDKGVHNLEWACANSRHSEKNDHLFSKEPLLQWWFMIPCR